VEADFARKPQKVRWYGGFREGDVKEVSKLATLVLENVTDVWKIETDLWANETDVSDFVTLDFADC
jgi:hypothetical protein